MPMGTEIERKFLVCGEGWRQGATSVVCRQGYLLSAVECTVRVRVIGEQGFLAIKGRTVGISGALPW